MKRKILLAVCVLLAAVFVTGVLAGCNATPKRVAGAGNSEIYPTVAATVTAIDGTDLVSFNRELVVISRQDGNTGSTLTGVYNYVTGKLIVPFDAQTVSFDVDPNANVFCVEDADTGKFTYYDRTGSVLAQNVTADTLFKVGNDFVEIGNNIFNVSNGEVKYQRVKGFGYDSDILFASEESENYYYYSDTSDNVKIFSKETGSLTAVLNGADYAYNTTQRIDAFVLYGDKVVLQYVDVLPEDAAKYDYALASGKFDIRHYIYDVEDGKVKEVKKFGYLIQNVKKPDLTANERAKYDESITNVLEVLKVEDKKLKSVVSFLSVSDSLKVKYDFDDITARTEYVVAFGDGYIATADNGDRYVYSKNNKFVALLGDTSVNGKYAVLGGDVYVLEGKEMKRIASYDANTFNILSIAGDHVLLQAIADGKYYGCTVGAAPQAFSGTVAYIENSRIYAVTDGTGTVAIYSVTGEQLLNGLSMFDVQATYVGADGKVTTLALINGSQYIVIR